MRVEVEIVAASISRRLALCARRKPAPPCGECAVTGVVPTVIAFEPAVDVEHVSRKSVVGADS